MLTIYLLILRPSKFNRRELFKASLPCSCCPPGLSNTRPIPESSDAQELCRYPALRFSFCRDPCRTDHRAFAHVGLREI